MTSVKRPLIVNPDVSYKRPRTDIMIHERKKEFGKDDIKSMNRTSSLPAPNMMLTGHSGEIFCGKFNLEGNILATAGHDRQIFFWNVLDECKNIGILPGHGGAILDIAFSNNDDFLFSASVDKSVIIWDCRNGDKIRRCKGHTNFINSVSVMKTNVELFCTGSDDCKIRMWDKRSKHTVQTLDAKYPILSTCYSLDGNFIYSGGIENVINQWDIRENKIVNSYRGHNDTVTGVSISKDGDYLLSNSMDNTVRVWDVKPWSPKSSDRCWRILVGHQHNFERNLLRCAWSCDGRLVTAGSSDRQVYIWDVHTGQLVYRLPGHTGSVNETDFHPKQPIIMSVSSDMKIILGEIQPF